MNVQAFNKELSKKVATANRNERNNKIEEAINAWVQVTEMALNASKSPGIPSEYRTMLIKKTEQIITHIKQLKVKLAIPRSKINESSKSEESQVVILDQQEMKDEPKVLEVDDNPETDQISNGFFEIDASRDFEIITPHDKLDPSIFKDAGKTVRLDDSDAIHEEKSSSDQLVLEKSKDGKTKICFACGTENPLGASSCKSCKTELD